MLLQLLTWRSDCISALLPPQLCKLMCTALLL